MIIYKLIYMSFCFLIEDNISSIVLIDKFELIKQRNRPHSKIGFIQVDTLAVLQKYEYR